MRGPGQLFPPNAIALNPASHSEARPDPVALALAEDLGAGDLTSRFFVAENQTGAARIVAREPAILAGLETAQRAFQLVDPALHVDLLRAGGDQLQPGDAVLHVTGRLASILTAERVALNFLQRLAGVATLTGAYVEAVRGTGVRLLDTRKTTPGLRALEKAAVRAGGGENHRFGLHDMILVKDNHLAGNSDPAWLQAAIGRARAAHPEIRIEIEADTLAQVQMMAALDGVNVILLDNMAPAEIRAALGFRRPGLQFEASGGVTLKTVRALAETGVDFISVGALTHSARAIDFGLDFVAG